MMDLKLDRKLLSLQVREAINFNFQLSVIMFYSQFNSLQKSVSGLQCFVWSVLHIGTDLLVFIWEKKRSTIIFIVINFNVLSSLIYYPPPY